MKSKINLLVLLGCITIAPIGFTQDAATNPAPAVGTPPAPPVTTNQAAAVITTNQTAATPPTNPAPLFPEVAASVTTNPAPAATEPAPTNATAVATPVAAEPAPTNAVAAGEPSAPAPAPAAPGATNSSIIPLIQFVDVPLTAAIENLARQANLNYILDPKINFGAASPDGRVANAPTISIRWENLTAEQALNTILKTYDLQIVEDANSKIARIAPKDPAAAEPLLNKVIQLKFASPSNILASVQSALTDKRSKVVTDVRTSQLVVVATEKEMASVNDLVERLDKPTKQVLIEAKILETTVNPKSVKGIDWSGTLSKQNVTFGNGRTTGKTTTTLPGTPTTDPAGRPVSTDSTSATSLETVLGNGGLSLNTLKGFSPATAFLNADGVSAALSFLNNSADTKVISEPRTVTLDNQKATIEVGLLYPIVNTSAGTANTAGGSSISYSNLTVNLDVTPRITANDFVELKVQQTILRLGPKFDSTVGGVANSVDSFFTRKVETSVLIPTGNTLVMGGLVSDENTSGNVKVPLLGDIPFLGQAFRKDTKERNRQNLIIFITPTIVQDEDFQPAQSKFLQTSPRKAESALDEGVPAWDSGKPYDWSKPFHKKSADE